LNENSLEQLLVRGEFKREKAVKVWEKIIARNGEENRDYSYLNFLDNLNNFNFMLAEYNFIKAALIKLTYCVDDELIKTLAVKGYPINTSGKNAYLNSLTVCLSKCENLTSKLVTKQNEMNEETSQEAKQVTAEQLIAQMSVAVGFSISDDVTLAAFNEYRKIVKQKNQHNHV